MSSKMKLRSSKPVRRTASRKNKPPAKTSAVSSNQSKKTEVRKVVQRKKSPPPRPAPSRRRKKSETESEESLGSDSDSFEAILAWNESRPYTTNRVPSKSSRTPPESETEDKDSTEEADDAGDDEDTADDGETKGIPDEWLCGICQGEVRYEDDGILCEAGCERWYHRECVKLTKMAYQLLQKEMSAEWACDRCIATGKVKMRRKPL